MEETQQSLANESRTVSISKSEWEMYQKLIKGDSARDDSEANMFGGVFAMVGSAVSLLGALANNLSLDHVLAMQLWMLSNPILFIWAVGIWRKWWNGGISAVAVVTMYFVFTITNFYGLFHGAL